MQRYFIPASSWQGDVLEVHGDDAHHMIKVLRYQIGDRVICNQLTGEAAICEITEIEQQTVRLQVIQWLNENNELPVEITIAQGLPKGDKLDLVLQKGTELGASAFIPLMTDRAVVKWDKRKADKKIQRFKKIVKEASEQSHRNRIPEILDTISLKELIKLGQSYDVKFFPYEEEAKVEKFQSFSTIVKELRSGQRVLTCIGPEGGFTTDEAELLKKNGFQPVRLGPRILRTETAPLYVLASISYQFEELGCR